MANSNSMLNNLRVKISLYILIGAVVFSGVIIFVTSHFLQKILTESLVKQGQIVASSIAELAAEKMIDNDKIGLKKISEKFRYTLSNEYIIIIDPEYNVVTDSYNGNIPLELTDNTVYQKFETSEVEGFSNELLQIGGNDIYDVILPIEEGLLGFVRVGLKKSFVDQQIQETLLYIGIVVAIGTLAAILVALMVITVQITRPVLHLANAAKEISLGNFNTPINLNIKNELNILAAAIDRMRESLKTSLDRLKTRSTMGRF